MLIKLKESGKVIFKKMFIQLIQKETLIIVKMQTQLKTRERLIIMKMRKIAIYCTKRQVTITLKVH